MARWKRYACKVWLKYNWVLIEISRWKWMRISHSLSMARSVVDGFFSIASCCGWSCVCCCDCWFVDGCEPGSSVVVVAAAALLDCCCWFEDIFTRLKYLLAIYVCATWSVRVSIAKRFVFIHPEIIIMMSCSCSTHTHKTLVRNLILCLMRVL